MYHIGHVVQIASIWSSRFSKHFDILLNGPVLQIYRVCVWLRYFFSCVTSCQVLIPNSPKLRHDASATYSTQNLCNVIEGKQKQLEFSCFHYIYQFSAGNLVYKSNILLSWRGLVTHIK